MGSSVVAHVSKPSTYEAKAGRFFFFSDIFMFKASLVYIGRPCQKKKKKKKKKRVHRWAEKSQEPAEVCLIKYLVFVHLTSESLH
jgi:hypothetical protein